MTDDRVDPKSVPPRPPMRSRSEDAVREKLLAALRELTHADRLALLEEANIDHTNNFLSLHHFTHNVIHPAVKAGEERDEAMRQGFAGLQAHLVKQDTKWSPKDWKTFFAGTAALVVALGGATAAIVAALHH